MKLYKNIIYIILFFPLFFLSSMGEQDIPDPETVYELPEEIIGEFWLINPYMSFLKLTS